MAASMPCPQAPLPLFPQPSLVLHLGARLSEKWGGGGVLRYSSDEEVQMRPKFCTQPLGLKLKSV